MPRKYQGRILGRCCFDEHRGRMLALVRVLRLELVPGQNEAVGIKVRDNSVKALSCEIMREDLYQTEAWEYK
jgi:hypothetical protein